MIRAKEDLVVSGHGPARRVLELAGTTEFEAIGTSGTIIATENVARETGVIESNDLNPQSVGLRSPCVICPKITTMSMRPSSASR